MGYSMNFINIDSYAKLRKIRMTLTRRKDIIDEHRAV